MKFLNDYFKYENGLTIGGLTKELNIFYLLELFNKSNKNVVLLTNTLYEANMYYDGISTYYDKVGLFPMDDFLTSVAVAISPDLKVKRLETLESIRNNKKSLIVTNLMGYLRYLPNKGNVSNLEYVINKNDTIKRQDILEILDRYGYIKESIVTTTGEYAVRGFIIDLFIIDEEHPIRIEFFGDEIDSIRVFDTDSQKSLESINKILIKPYFEFITDRDVPDEKFGKQKYLPEYGCVQSISDYLRDSITIFKDYEQLELSFGHIMEEVVTYKETKDVNFSGNYMFDLTNIKCDFPVYYMTINNIVNNKNIDYLKDFGVRTINNFSENITLINNFIRKAIDEKKTVLICLKKHQLRNIVKILNMKVVESSFSDIKREMVNLIEGEVNQGFIYNDLVVLSARELFINNNNKKKYKTKFKYTVGIQDINKLNIGDYVVHENHGLGIYQGIEKIEVDKIAKDYMKISYAKGGNLYIPATQLDLIQKYASADAKKPKLKAENSRM